MEAEKKNIPDDLYSYALHLSANRISNEEMENKLLTKTNDPELIQLVLKKIKKHKHEENKKSGLIKLFIGIILLVLSFVITCVNFHANQSFTTVMYSFTSIGLCIIFWGLYEIIG